MTSINYQKNKRSARLVSFLASVLVVFCTLWIVHHVSANSLIHNESARVETSSGGLESKVVPGGKLPISVKLSNFGGNGKTDVLITYNIINEKGNVIFTENETVAVETTASFIKTLVIPADAHSGIYIAQATVSYAGQTVPASTEFPFFIESRFFAITHNWFIVETAIAILVGVIIGIVGRTFHKRYRVL
jgi:hypothetical protein